MIDIEWDTPDKLNDDGSVATYNTHKLDCCDYSKGAKKTLYNDAKNISICLKSLIQIDEKKRYNTLIIDEIESVLDCFVGSFMEAIKSNVLNKLINIIRGATKIIVLDAFITTKTINF